MDTRLPHKVIPRPKQTAKPSIVMVLGVVIAGCGPSLTGQLDPLPHDDPEPAEQQDSEWVETWETAQPRNDQRPIFTEQGVWEVSEVASHDCGHDCWAGCELSVVAGQRLLLRSRSEAGYDGASCPAFVFIDLMDSVPGGIPLTPQTVVSAFFECDFFFRNPPADGYGEGAFARFIFTGDGFAPMIYEHQGTVDMVASELTVVSGYFRRRLYDDILNSWVGQSSPIWGDPPLIGGIGIQVDAWVNSRPGRAETAEVTCYVDDVTITEE